MQGPNTADDAIPDAFVRLDVPVLIAAMLQTPPLPIDNFKGIQEVFQKQGTICVGSFTIDFG